MGQLIHITESKVTHLKVYRMGLKYIKSYSKVAHREENIKQTKTQLESGKEKN